MTHGVHVPVTAMPMHFAIVDPDQRLILDRGWCLDKGYAVCKYRGKKRTMHSMVMGPRASSSVAIDHINGNRLDNRKQNLRWVTRTQNSQNRHKVAGESAFKGVTRDKKKWRAQIRIDGEQVNLGGFHSQEEAARSYDAAAQGNFGEYAVLNFPKSEVYADGFRPIPEKTNA